MRSWVLTVVMLGAVLAGPVMKTEHASLQDILIIEEFSRNSAMEQIILNLLEDLRQMMIDGGEDIPVLDPLQLEQINIDGDSLGLEGSHLVMSNILAENLSTFVVHDFTMTMVSILQQRYDIAFDVSIPSIDIEISEYDLLLRALDINIFGNGEASIKILEPRLSGSITARLSISIIGGGGISLNVESSDVKVGLGGLEPNFRGLFGNEAASDFVNSFIGNLVPELIAFYENDISAFLNSIIPDLVNGILGRHNLKLM